MKLLQLISEIKKISNPQKAKFIKFNVGDKVKFFQHDGYGDRWVEGIIEKITLYEYNRNISSSITDNIAEAHIGYFHITGYNICNNDNYFNMSVYFDYDVIGNKIYKKYDDQRFDTLEKIN